MNQIEPRSYKPTARVLDHAFEVMLNDHPEAFDCIIWPAMEKSHDEILADNQPVATLLDSDERAQEYDKPFIGRAMIVPANDLDFGATESGRFESFHNATGQITLLLSVPDLRRFSLVQWREYLDLESEETVDRVVYIAEIEPMGRTLGAGMRYVCYPLPAMGEKPQTEPDKQEDDKASGTDNEEDYANDTGVGVL